MHHAHLITITPGAEQLIGDCARVSNPSNQGTSPERLIRYCIKHGHWSILEMAHMVLEIHTTRAIAPQILRHRSFSFQEFSQRYAWVEMDTEPANQRLAGATNRQSSLPADNPTEDQRDALAFASDAVAVAVQAYARLRDAGFAAETARTVLPLCTPTTMYMAGSIRSWLHYIDLRTKPDTQAEHQAIARSCKAIFCREVPTVADAMGWLHGETD